MKGDGSSPPQRRNSVSERLAELPRSQAPKCLMQDVNSCLSEKYKQKYFQQDDEFLVNRIATEKINKCGEIYQI